MSYKKRKELKFVACLFGSFGGPTLMATFPVLNHRIHGVKSSDVTRKPRKVAYIK
jgi:hypothetical protein